MPLPMVHLHVAVLFANACPEHVERGSFYLGNIAPDSIHMRDPELQRLDANLGS
ncbi:hypothetical protein [Paenibacillus sp. MABNR03]|uniref:hypothetical protein n=1 Tax=Paenibacillus sp. MABNR03 TaxID=3142626 RepID=UPI003D2909DA